MTEREIIEEILLRCADLMECVEMLAEARHERIKMVQRVARAAKEAGELQAFFVDLWVEARRDLAQGDALQRGARAGEMNIAFVADGVPVDSMLRYMQIRWLTPN